LREYVQSIIAAEILLIKTYLQVFKSLGLSFKSSNELNKIIDDQLPGRPRFERHEIMVANEVCEVYFRDVIACIKALYGDPDFAQYLVFLPEKHYVDEGKTQRMYHDMHTGKWWWSTQVRSTLVVALTPHRSPTTFFRNNSRRISRGQP